MFAICDLLEKRAGVLEYEDRFDRAEADETALVGLLPIRDV